MVRCDVVVSADRKAVISQGLLKCIGSSLYLKIKCGVGYQLRQENFTFTFSSQLTEGFLLPQTFG